MKWLVETRTRDRFGQWRSSLAEGNPFAELDEAELVVYQLQRLLARFEYRIVRIESPEAS